MRKAKAIAQKMVWYLILVLAFLCPIAVGVRIVLLRNFWFMLAFGICPIAVYVLFYLARYIVHVCQATRNNTYEAPANTKHRMTAAIPERIANLDALSNIPQKQYTPSPVMKSPSPDRMKTPIRYSFVTIPYRFACMFLARMYHKRIAESTKRKRYHDVIRQMGNAVWPFTS